MAEFVQTMKDWRRMCKDRRCDACRLRSVDGICNTDPYSRTDEDIIKIENTVTEWAAEHPVVYPTWYEWLTSIGAVTRKVKPDVASTLIETGLLDPIPADIAQKLGLQPKEG